MSRYLVLFIGLLGIAQAQTPVIGGACKLGTADVQIGGKQTQFFLKCEAASGSPEGEGVWVVKSRAAAAPAAPAASASAAVPPTLAPAENTQPQQRPPSRKQSNPNICEQDNNAREADSCAVSATCLQANNEYPTTYLQCDQTSMRWVKKSCQDGFIFNFEQQTCIVPKRPANAMSRQQASGLVCTYSSCSNSNPCSTGTCNNGYCCSSGGSSASSIIVASPSSGGCVGCNQQAPQIITIPAPSSCPGGGYSVGSCYSGSCSTGYQCIQGNCCPSYSSGPSISIYTCPSGGSAVGSCISGQCATGYSCVQNQCCPTNTRTSNPFICSDGTQAVGGCVNGQCGTGYTCNNGLCCAGSSSTTVRCLDGSDAVGACIPSCTGNACGGVQVTYYCGSGYTCTTGNICCPVTSCPGGADPIGPPINGIYCPAGYTVNNGVCCPSLCADGSTPVTTTTGTCATGYTLLTGSTTLCCASTSSTTTLYGNCTSPTGTDMSIGPCDAAGSCLDNLGYACDITGELCCPVVNTIDPSFQIGPGVGGMCPLGYALVYLNPTTYPDGVCIDLQSISGICDASVQSGPCVNSACGTGYTCFTYADVCCPETTFSRLKKTGRMVRPRPNYGRPLSSFMAPNRCPDGSSPNGSCMNGLCGLGLECVGGMCCSPSSSGSSSSSKLKSICPSGETAVSGCFSSGTCGTGFECVQKLNLCCPPGDNALVAQTTAPAMIRPIGANCFVDEECVGNGEGLSLCHAGICQCSPIAYSQGIACVRRKAMQMNDSPLEDKEVPADAKTSN